MKCIYCLAEKNSSEFSKEHILPQSLGGQRISEKYITNRVCKNCNSNMGMFVDAAFLRNRFVSNYMTMMDLEIKSSSSEAAALLPCGSLEGVIPDQKEDEICELFIGPHGETVFFVRPYSGRFESYVGGNPRDLKSAHCVMYMTLSVHSEKNLEKSLRSLGTAFPKVRNLRKVMITDLEGANYEKLGFSRPLEEEKNRIDYLMELLKEKKLRTRSSIDLNTETRFLAKLGRGFAHILFGDKVLTSRRGVEIGKALHLRPGTDYPNVDIDPFFKNEGSANTCLLGLKEAVVLAVFTLDDRVVLNFCINAAFSSSIIIEDGNCLTKEDYQRVGQGIVLAVWPHQNRDIETNLDGLFLEKMKDLDFMDHFRRHRFDED